MSGDLPERLRGNEPLPLCPYDRRSPDYWTAPDDEPCRICGGLNEDGAPDLCRGADTRCMSEAADALEAKDAEIARLSALVEEAGRVIEPFAEASDRLHSGYDDGITGGDRPMAKVFVSYLRAARSLSQKLKEKL